MHEQYGGFSVPILYSLSEITRIEKRQSDYNMTSIR